MSLETPHSIADAARTSRSFLLSQRFWLVWFPLMAYSGGLLVISVIPMPHVDLDVKSSDKIGHAIAYAVLSYMVFRALKSRLGSGWKASVTALLIASGYGAIMELGQFFLPYRDYEPLDLVSNAAGAAAVQGVILLLRNGGSLLKSGRETTST